MEIYRQAVNLFDLPLAAALAIMQLIGVSTVLYFYSRYQERKSFEWALEAGSARRNPTGTSRFWIATAVIGTLTALSIPLTVLVARSWNSDFYRGLFQRDPVVGTPISAVANSLLIAGVAMLLATVIGVMASTVITGRRGGLSRWFDLTLMLPLGTSAVTVGFGFIIALGWPIDLRATIWLIPIAHALIAVPFVVRSTVPSLRAIPGEWKDAAATLGASPWRVWREIDLPIISRAALVGSGFAFVISLGEFGATSFIARPTTPTIPTMIFRLLSRPGQISFGMAMALSVVLAALTAGIVMWIDRAQAGDIGRF